MKDFIYSVKQTNCKSERLVILCKEMFRVLRDYCRNHLIHSVEESQMHDIQKWIIDALLHISMPSSVLCD